MPDISKIEETLYELEETISPQEAAAIVKTSAVTIRTWCEVYHIGKKIGGRYRIFPDKLNLLLKGSLKRDLFKR